MIDGLKSCPFGSRGKPDIEGKGQIWRGTRGYSDPQYFQLCYHGQMHDEDTFPTVFIQIRARTEEQAREMWNTRADLPATDAQAMQNEKVKKLVEAAQKANTWLLTFGARPEFYRKASEELCAALAQLKDGDEG